MKIEITTSAKNVEMANFLLAQGYKSAIESKRFMADFNVTKKDLDKAEVFRKSLLKSFLKK